MPPTFASFRPYDTVPNTTWPDKPPAMSPEQLSTIHDTLDGVLKESIPETMMALGLTGMAVQPDIAAADSQPAPTKSQ